MALVRNIIVVVVALAFYRRFIREAPKSVGESLKEKYDYVIGKFSSCQVVPRLGEGKRGHHRLRAGENVTMALRNSLPQSMHGALARRQGSRTHVNMRIGRSQNALETQSRACSAMYFMHV